MKPLKIMINILVLLSVACNNNNAKVNYNDSVATSTVTYDTSSEPALNSNEVYDHIVCKNDSTQSYAIYIPLNTEKFTAIYFFDPHGDGSLPVKKYKNLADKYKYVLIGSNNSKNGNNWQATENIWQNLFTSTQERFIFNRDRIYTCGFSGGAKVASYLALHHNEISSVIVGGTGLPDETPAGNFNFSFTALAGEGDMNMTDLVSLNNDLDKTQTTHRIIFFNGKHEWAPESAMDIAFAGLQLDLMRKKFITKNDLLINVYINNSKKRIDGDEKKNDWINAQRECALSINMLNGIADASFFTQKNNSIINNAVYKNQLQQQQNLFATEQNKKAEYSQHFQQEDANYWSATINDLFAKSKGTTAEAAMYQRLLAYLSLAFYSISNQLINGNQNSDAAFFVTLYKTVDPTNSEAWYFSAILNARNNNASAAHDDLLKAVSNGFNDQQRLMQQQEFVNLQSQINLPEIEAKIKK